MNEELNLSYDEDVVETEVNNEYTEQSVESEEAIDIVITDNIEEIEIEIEESTGWVGGDITRHYSLAGRDENDQHPIKSITGLREELDQIESLQTIYSDKKQHADYYKWHDDNLLKENRDGFFVSICEDTNYIRTCNDKDDVFGVTIAEAGFVGGQEYVQVTDGTKIGRDRQYGLVVYSGLVGVRRETTVVVGDYVVPNSRGEAKKSEGDYGYLVTALSEVHGVKYAIISLGSPLTFAQKISDGVKDLGSRMGMAEFNITSVTNVANSAYAIAQDTEINSEYMEEKIIEVFGRIDKIDGEDGVIDNLNQSINNACSDAALAKVIANDAVSAAQHMGDDAYASANEAIAAIKDIGAGSTSWAKRICAYSVGEYSQAYGLTWEQAKSALPKGVVYIPTISYTEVYDGASIYEQEFYIGYYYEWNGEEWAPSLSTAVNFSSVYITGSEQTPYWVVTDSDVEYNGVIYKLGYLYKWENNMWSTTGASVAENTLARAVSAIHQTSNELSMEVSDIKGNVAIINTQVDENKASVQTLTSWVGKDDKKRNIATIDQSANQDGSKIALVVVNDTEDEIVGGASIVLNDGEKGSYIQFDADYINFATGEFIIDASHIDFDASEFTIDADHINFTATADYSVIAENIKMYGYVTFTNLEEVNDQTHINGGNIITNTITSEQLNASAIKSNNYNSGNSDEEGNTILKPTSEYSICGTFIDLETGSIYTPKFGVNGETGEAYFNGTLDASQIISGNIDTELLNVDELSSISANLGTITAGVIQSENYEVAETGEVTGAAISFDGDPYIQFPQFSVDHTGHIIADSGKLGGIVCESQLVDHNIFTTDKYTLDITTGTIGTSNNDNTTVLYLGTYSGTVNGMISDAKCTSLLGNPSVKFSDSTYTVSVWSENPSDTIQNVNVEITYISGMEQKQHYYLRSIDDSFKVETFGEESIVDCGSAIINQLDTEKLSSETISSKLGVIGGIRIESGLMSYESSAIDFNPEGISEYASYSATISFQPLKITIRVNDALEFDKSFTIAYNNHVSSKWYIKNVIMKAGSTSLDIDYNGWALEKVKFVDEFGNRVDVLEFTQNKGRYITTTANFAPVEHGTLSLGVSTSHGWNNIYGKQIYQGAAQVSTSDRNKKNTISYLTGNDSASLLFDELKPATFKFNDGTSGRTHYGFIAQDIKESLDDLNINTNDFAAYCEWEEKDSNGNMVTTCGVGYEELIAMCVSEIQGLKKQVKALQEELKTKQSD